MYGLRFKVHSVNQRDTQQDFLSVRFEEFKIFWLKFCHKYIKAFNILYIKRQLVKRDGGGYPKIN